LQVICDSVYSNCHLADIETPEENAIIAGLLVQANGKRMFSAIERKLVGLKEQKIDHGINHLYLLLCILGTLERLKQHIYN
jgi:hypothetical protein